MAEAWWSLFAAITRVGVRRNEIEGVGPTAGQTPRLSWGWSVKRPCSEQLLHGEEKDVASTRQRHCLAD